MPITVSPNSHSFSVVSEGRLDFLTFELLFIILETKIQFNDGVSLQRKNISQVSDIMQYTSPSTRFRLKSTPLSRRYVYEVRPKLFFYKRGVRASLHTPRLILRGTFYLPSAHVGNYVHRGLE